MLFISWALTGENLSLVFANNKGADQPEHPRSLTSAFVIRLLEIIISSLDTSDILILSVLKETESGVVGTPKTGFLATWPSS